MKNKLTNILGASLLALNSAGLDAKQMTLGNETYTYDTNKDGSICLKSYEIKDTYKATTSNCSDFDKVDYLTQEIPWNIYSEDESLQQRHLTRLNREKLSFYLRVKNHEKLNTTTYNPNQYKEAQRIADEIDSWGKK